MTEEQLRGFLKYGYFTLEQKDNGEFGLSAHVRGKGGGWEWITNVIHAWHLFDLFHFTESSRGDTAEYDEGWQGFYDQINAPNLHLLIAKFEAEQQYKQAQETREILRRLQQQDPSLFPELQSQFQQARKAAQNK